MISFIVPNLPLANKIISFAKERWLIKGPFICIKKEAKTFLVSNLFSIVKSNSALITKREGGLVSPYLSPLVD